MPTPLTSSHSLCSPSHSPPGTPSHAPHSTYTLSLARPAPMPRPLTSLPSPAAGGMACSEPTLPPPLPPPGHVQVAADPPGPWHGRPPGGTLAPGGGLEETPTSTNYPHHSCTLTSPPPTSTPRQTCAVTGEWAWPALGMVCSASIT